jgi:hypothetical protein
MLFVHILFVCVHESFRTPPPAFRCTRRLTSVLSVLKAAPPTFPWTPRLPLSYPPSSFPWFISSFSPRNPSSPPCSPQLLPLFFSASTRPPFPTPHSFALIFFSLPGRSSAHGRWRCWSHLRVCRIPAEEVWPLVINYVTGVKSLGNKYAI